MSSPHLSPTAVPSTGRKIAPLPMRTRARGNGSSSTYRASSENSQSLSTSSNINDRRSSFSSADTISTTNDLLSGQDVPRIAVQASLPRDRFLSTEQEDRNIDKSQSPSYVISRPSEGLGEVPRSSAQGSPASSSYALIHPRTTPDTEISQPLHTMYSGEEIVISNAYDLPDRSIAVTDGEYLSTSTASPRVSYGDLEGSLSPSQNSDLSPAGRRQRAVSELSDVSFQDELDDSIGPYNVKDEEAPQEPFFSLAFQTALQNGLGIANKVALAIEKCVGGTEASVDLERLIEDARRLGLFQCSDTRTIAVLGDSGEGKSSLINSLLHFPEIAKTGDIGAACTSVVTEYRQKLQHHTSPITIDVEYLSAVEIEELINELVWNYRQIFLPEIEADNIDSKEYARYQRESEQAWSALEAGFKHQRGFNKQMLCDMSEGGLTKATDQLIQWARELVWPGGGESGVWTATADTADECCVTTSIFMQDRFWPFTKIIRVYLNSYVLRTGVILADLPGLQDTNLARVRATQEYLLTCDNIFIVAKISRAITDQSLKSSLYSILARHAPVECEESGMSSLNIAVVCTKSEDINQTTARREFCGVDKKIPSLLMEKLDRDIEEAKKNHNKALKKQLKRKQEFLLIEARNSHVKEGLQQAYASKTPGGKLDVFCISNTIYEKYSRKGNTEMVHSSGIPELRRFCITITAGAQLREAKHFLQSTLSSLLSSVEIWATSSPLSPQITGEGEGEDEDRRRESIHNFLKVFAAEVSNTIDQSKFEFRQTFQEVLSEYLEKRNEAWEEAADAKGREWHGAGWHWTQYNAWCLHRGAHSTGKRSYLNWNSELIWKMRMELAYQWGLLEDEIPIVFDALLQSFKTSFSNLQTHLREQGFSAALVQGIDFRVQDVEYKTSLIRQDFAREVKTVQRHASEPNDSSYIVSEMIPAYRHASEQSGGGKAARQRFIVQDRITNGTLFPQISASIQQDITRITHKTFRRLQGEMAEIIALVSSDVVMELASRPVASDAVCRIGSGNEDTAEEEKGKEELMVEILRLKGEHAELLSSISDM